MEPTKRDTALRILALSWIVVAGIGGVVVLAAPGSAPGNDQAAIVGIGVIASVVTRALAAADGKQDRQPRKR
jgi:hypothetical protein